MLSDITLGQYFPGDTVIHKLDPRAKLLAVIALIVEIFLASNVLSYILLTVFLVWIVYVSQIGMKMLWKGLKPVVAIIILTFVLNVLFTPGAHPILEWQFIHISTEGLKAALKMVVRLVLLVMCTQMLTFTTSPIALTDAMERLMKPLSKIGFPSHELAMMMSIAMRFIPTLIEETDKIMKAQKSRGADFESGSILVRAKAMVPLLVPLFLGAFRRADELSLAMEARCYHGGNGRTSMKRLVFEKRDYYCGAIVFLMLVLVIVLNMIL